MTNSQHVYEIHPRKDERGVDLISDALPFGRLWYPLGLSLRKASTIAGQQIQAAVFWRMLL